MPTRLQPSLLSRRFCIYVTPEMAVAIDTHARTNRLMQPSSWAREALLAQLAAEGNALPRYIASRMRHGERVSKQRRNTQQRRRRAAAGGDVIERALTLAAKTLRSEEAEPPLVTPSQKSAITSAVFVV